MFHSRYLLVFSLALLFTGNFINAVEQVNIYSSSLYKFQLYKEQLGFNIYRPPLLDYSVANRIHTIKELFPISKKEKNDDTVVKYGAQDAIIIDIATHTIRLCGRSTIDYDKFKLAAEEVSLDWITNTITAKGKENVIGELVGQPVFTLEEKDGQESDSAKERVYYSEKIQYNIDTKKAIAYKLVTKRDDAVMKARKLKKHNEDTLYMGKVRYTTCNLSDPHFYISAQQSKMILGRKFFSGPFRFYFNDVPTPLGFFFGVLFFPGNRTHGIIPPEPGEDSEQGFYLKNGGYYFNFNDYVTLALQGDVYTIGNTTMKNKLHYKKRYMYEGQLNYNRYNIDSKDGWEFKWWHKTSSSIRNRGLIANVNIESEAYHTIKKIEKKVGKVEKKNTKTDSSVTYIDKLGSFPYELKLRIEHKKDFEKNVVTYTFPKVLLTTGKMYPFRIKSDVASGKRWYSDIYKKISISHGCEYLQELSNVKRGVKVVTKDRIFDNIRNGIQHTIPIETKIKLFKYFNLNSKFEYTEWWYWEKLNYHPSYPSNRDVRPKIIKGFVRAHQYEAGVGINTNLYAMHIFNKGAIVEAIRLTTTPAVNLKYIPDLSKPTYNYYQKVIIGGEDKKKTRFLNAVYRGPQEHAEATLKMEINNMLEFKVQDPDNTEDKNTTKNITILKALNLETEYDFKKDSFPLGNIKFKGSTGDLKLKNITISMNASVAFDPYMYKEVPGGKIERINGEFFWNHGKYLGRVDNASFNIDFTWQGEETMHKKDNNKEEIPISYMYLFSDTAQKNVNFNLPWRLNSGYHWSYIRDTLNQKEISNFIDFRGEFNLTKKWKIGFVGQYNITKNSFSHHHTKIAINRDLHCWEMRYEWYPLGKKSSYDFSIGVKAEVLKLIKYPRKRTYKNMKTLGEH